MKKKIKTSESYSKALDDVFLLESEVNRQLLCLSQEIHNLRVDIRNLNNEMFISKKINNEIINIVSKILEAKESQPTRKKFLGIF